nr:RNA-directed DNA polymerase, eukaryota [Tanacetum cinerariifolium]
KAKIQWAIEGDENSNFFHGILNKKRATLSIRGVMVDGDWVVDPICVKEVFRSHFASRFNDPGDTHCKISCSFPNRLSPDQVSEMECQVSNDDIRQAVWGCGEDKSPGPDGFSQILDGPFIVNELLDWCKHHKHQAMVFKVDFAKAYDSIRWDYLIDVLRSFGFGDKWCSWIKGCLYSSMASILVNGSPTSEFQIHQGLKQGDPLAPYLFILVMESLHLSFSRVVESGLFKGISIDNTLTLSHLFYADDAIFIGEWSEDNLNRILHVFHCFSLASGLKINVHKSQLLSVGIPLSITSAAALMLGCSVMTTPFKYLGVMVGGNMSRINAWDDSIHKLKTRLSKWKLKRYP